MSFDPSLILRAMLLRDASDVNLRVMEDALKTRHAFDLEYNTRFST